MALDKAETIICHDLNDVVEKAATSFADTATEFIRKKSLFNVVLSGGSTPQPLYQLLSSDRFRNQIDWTRVQLFWGDERCVPPTDRASNYGMATKSLISKIKIPFKNIHRIKGEMGEDSACFYEKELRSFFSLGKDAFPKFDLIILGIGEDGHTASIFPGSPVVNETSDMVAADYVDKLSSTRITLTPPTINNASNIMVLACGNNKADAIKEIFEGDSKPDIIPSQFLRKAKGKVSFFLDEPAASKLASLKA
ncbi:MAG: 6-phosphogluconolactonase [Proteobacteria bacterium]|nr:6-phosphogluconolactonase [Pseudomonadota bacterium]